MNERAQGSKTPHRGEHITVYDGNQVELGEGTFLERGAMGDIAVYECEEHTILARGEHWLKIGDAMINVPFTRSTK